MANPPRNRHSIRLKDYDYSQSGCYFVTVCTWRRDPTFGSIFNDAMAVNAFGKVVEEVWLELPHLYSFVELDEFVVMTDHFHGILFLTEGTQEPRPRRPGLPDIMRSFKSQSARRINLVRGEIFVPIWQRGYYDHIIRNESELGLIREYVLSNPSHKAVAIQYSQNIRK